jgi:hypothetical protein
MPKITADIPQELYKSLRGWIVDRRLAGEPITVSAFITDLISKWKTGGFKPVRTGGSEPEEEEQAISTPIPTLAHPSLERSDSLLDATWEQIEADIESRHLTKEQMEKLAAGLIEANKLLLNVIKPEREK